MPKKELQNGFLFQDENMFVFATARKLPSVDMSARSMMAMRVMRCPRLDCVCKREASIGAPSAPSRAKVLCLGAARLGP